MVSWQLTPALLSLGTGSDDSLDLTFPVPLQTSCYDFSVYRQKDRSTLIALKCTVNRLIAVNTEMPDLILSIKFDSFFSRSHRVAPTTGADCSVCLSGAWYEQHSPNGPVKWLIRSGRGRVACMCMNGPKASDEGPGGRLTPISQTANGLLIRGSVKTSGPQKSS